MNYFIRSNPPGNANGTDWYNAFASWSPITSILFSGDIDNIYISDDVCITGSFNLVYSGFLNVYGGFNSDLLTSGTDLPPLRFNTEFKSNVLNSISGIINIKNLDLVNIRISNYGDMAISDSTIKSGNFINYNSMTVANVDSCGYNNNDFITSYSSNLSIIDSNISNYNVAIHTYSGFSNIHNTILYKNSYGLVLVNSSGIVTNLASVMNQTGILTDSYLGLESSTLYDTIPIVSTSTLASVCLINKCVIQGTSSSVTVAASGNITNSIIYPASVGTTNTNTKALDPFLNNPTKGDIRLQLDSPALDLVSLSSNTIEIESPVVGFKIMQGSYKVNLADYTYINDNNLLISNYLNETRVGSRYAHPLYTYTTAYRRKLKYYNVVVQSSFIKDINAKDPWPYDWDMQELKVPSKTTRYLIPRSIVDIKQLTVADNIIGSTKIKNIKAFIKPDYRGISYDFDKSQLGRNVIWYLDANTHVLYEKNLFNNEVLNAYPLMCPDISFSGYKGLVAPSGLIYNSQTTNDFKFILERDPNVIISAKNQFGMLDWICTEKTMLYDLNGVLVNKDVVFITGQDANDHGYMFQYNTRDNIFNFMKSPITYNLVPENYQPRDMTVLEDGTILISDAASGAYLYNYKFMYDYALKESLDGNKTKLIFRENYTNIQI